MASLFSRLLSKFQKPSMQERRSRPARNRKLRLEPMEPRRLLAGDLGVIEGNVFTDLTDNGLTNDDLPVNGALIRLYQDTGNGTFGNEDILLEDITTGASGNYRFDGLGPGLYFVQQQAVAGQLQRDSETLKTVEITDEQSEGVGVLTVDNFADDTATIIANEGTPISSGQTNTTSDNTLGGQRDVVAHWSNQGQAVNNVQVLVDDDALNITLGPGTGGGATVVYDGIDGSATTNAHGLDVDLTEGGATAFEIVAGASGVGTTLVVNVYSGAGAYSTLNIPIPQTFGGNPTAQLVLEFDEFDVGLGGGADFENVTAIEFIVNVAPGTAATLILTQTLAPYISTQNFANLNPMSIGDQVWRDSNNNGIMDIGESGIAGVSLELYEDTNGNGVYNPGIDALIDTTTSSGAGGNYLFDNLFPGDYFVVIPESLNFQEGQPLYGLLPSSGTAADSNNDVDNDNNGEWVAGVGVVSAGVLMLRSGTEPSGGGNLNDTVDFLLAPQIDLAIEKSVHAPTITAGNLVTYTLEVTNNGPSDAENVVVVDNLPDFLVIENIANITAGPDGTVELTDDETGEIRVTYPLLEVDESRTITIVARVPAGQAAATNVLNTATVTGDGVELEEDLDDNTSSVPIAINRNALLTIVKTDSPDPVAIGGELTYTITVTNTGPSTANNVVVTDTLPAALQLDGDADDINSSVAGSVINVVGNQISVTVPSLAVGASVIITIPTIVLDTFTGTSITNEATAQATETGDVVVEDSETTDVNPQLNLTITKTDNVDPVNRGGTLTYTIVVTNSGPSGATDVVVVDTLPASVTFSDAEVDGIAATPTINGNQLTFNVGNLAANASRTITIDVTVGQDAPGTLNNTATVSSAETEAGFEEDDDNEASEPTTVQSTIDLGVTKQATGGTVPGQTVTYTVTVTNTGPSNATAVLVTDNIPDGIQITNVVADRAGVTITNPASLQDTNPSNPDDLIVDVGNLAVGENVVITITANVLAATTGQLTNLVTVETTNTSLIETELANNTASVTTTLDPQVALAIQKSTTAGATVVAGNLITYSILVTNNGASTATGVTVTDTLPSGLTNATITSGNATISGGVITGNLGTLDPTQTATITVQATVDPTARGTLSNSATVDSNQTDPLTSNVVTTTVDAVIDLGVTKTKVNPTELVMVGGTFNYQIVVSNSSSVTTTATGVVVTDTLPTGVTPVTSSIVTTQGTVSVSGQTVTVNVGTLAPGATATITLPVNVANNAPTSLANTATVTPAEGETDNNPSNNSSTVNTPVAEPASLAGRTYEDVNRNGIFDAGDVGIPGVTITLTGTNDAGTPVNLTTQTDTNGQYQFASLVPGLYTITQTQPGGFISIITVAGTAGGTVGENVVSNIDLNSGIDATGYDFLEAALSGVFSKRMFLAST